MAVWTRIADLSIKKGNLSLSCVDGKIYAIGGYTGTTDLAMNECYDKSSNAWSQKADAQSILSSHSAVVIGDEIYTLGSSSGTYNKVSAYNTVTNTWRLVTTTPYNVYLGGAVTHNGYIYLIGGLFDGTANDNLYRLDLTTNTWTKLASLPVTRDSFACCVTPNGYIYVIGGKNDSLGQTTSDAIYRYSIAADAWELINVNLPEPMSNGRAIYSHGNIYIAGGENRSGYLRYFLEYNIEKNTITELTTIPTGTYSHGFCIDENDNTLYLAGGFAGGFYVPTAYSYQLNQPPEIIVGNTSLGSFNFPLIKKYTINDNSTFTIVEELDNEVLRTLNNQSSGEFTLDLTAKWNSLSLGSHTITLTATDEDYAVGKTILTFNKIVEDLPLTTDLVTVVGNINGLNNFVLGANEKFKAKLTQLGITIPAGSGIQEMIDLIPKPKKVLNGSATPNGEYATFTYAGTTATDNSYYIEIPKFDFEPRLILIETLSADGYDYYTSVFNKESDSVNYNTVSCSYHTRTTNSATNKHWKIDNFVNTTTAYKIPVIASGELYKWIAYE